MLLTGEIKFGASLILSFFRLLILEKSFFRGIGFRKCLVFPNEQSAEDGADDDLSQVRDNRIFEKRHFYRVCL